MSVESGTRVVYAALAGNTLIAVSKLGAAIFTGSSAMFSEAVHSFVDTGNQGLILLGIARAKRDADETHPFGYGMELYFWSFVVAILIFGLGAGISFYEGVSKILEPHPVSSFLVNYIVLGLAVAFETAAWVVAFRAFNKSRGRTPFFEAVRSSKDPTIFTVLFEDTAALLGLFAAFAGLLAVQFLGLEWADGAASIVIGTILAFAALVLAIETKSLLTGESAGSATVREIRRLLLSEPVVYGINELRTVHFGPHDVLAAISLDFRDDCSIDDVEAAVSRLEHRIKTAFPKVTRVFIEAQEAHHGGTEPQPTLPLD